MRKNGSASSILIALALLVSAAQAAKIWMASVGDMMPAQTSGETARASSGTAPTTALPAPAPDTPATEVVRPTTPPPLGARTIAAFLPREAAPVLVAIDRRGPFAYEKDGTTFQNRERRLPARPRGFYREYTVETPGSDDRGARRIITGGDPPTEYYYTDDHYASFRRFEHVPGEIR